MVELADNWTFWYIDLFAWFPLGLFYWKISPDQLFTFLPQLFQLSTILNFTMFAFALSSLTRSLKYPGLRFESWNWYSWSLQEDDDRVKNSLFHSKECETNRLCKRERNAWYEQSDSFQASHHKCNIILGSWIYWKLVNWHNLD